jgi:RNA polymerase sigma factor (sigma-70 family)
VGGRGGGALNFESFFAAHYDRTRRILAVMLGDPIVAEEASQEAFYRAYRRWTRVSRMDRPDSWVFVVGLNHARDTLRRRGRDHAAEQVAGRSESEWEPTRSIELIDEIGRLPTRQQEAIALRYLLDMSVQDVATAMKCAVGTVKSTLHTALETLRVQLTESADL